MRRLVIGEDPLAINAMWLKMTDAVYGDRTAIGGIDIALHDIAGKALGVPVYQLLGGKCATNSGTHHGRVYRSGD